MPDEIPTTADHSDKIAARAQKWQAKYGRAYPARETTTDADCAEAFMKVCEALGIAATPLAYLEVPTIIRATYGRGYSDAVRDERAKP